MKRNFNQTGKNIYRANYLLPGQKEESTRLIICENMLQAEKEIDSYKPEKASIELIEDDISLVILESSN